MKYTNEENIPLAFAVLLATDNYDKSYEPKTISATSIQKSIREIVLGLRCKTSENALQDIKSKLSSAIGTAIHSALEQAWLDPYKALEALDFKGYKDVKVNPIELDIITWKTYNHKFIPVYVEQRVNKKINDWTISGKYDLILDGEIQDLKNRKAYSYINQSNKEKDIIQGSIYKWLNPKIVTQDTMKIIWNITDWDAIKALSDAKYPKQRIFAQQLPLMSLSDTERYLKKKLQDIQFYLDNLEIDLPYCTPEELWMRNSEWKYYKNPLSSRATKKYSDSASAWSHFHNDGGVGKVVEFKGKAKYCEHCSISSICSQYTQLQIQQLV